MKQNRLVQPRCCGCGRFFKPNARVSKKQKYGHREKCQKKRKKINQADWHACNPDYFKGRYHYLKEWRAQNPKHQQNQRANKRREIQDSIKGNSSIISVCLLITDPKLKIEIQDAIRTQRAAGRGFLVYGYPTRDTSLDSCVPSTVVMAPP